MSGYRSFATFYDILMQDVDYAARADYLLQLFARHGGAAQSLLDVACGTGRLSVQLAQRGVDVIGIDGSEDMLSLARQNAPGQMFVCQDMQALDLYGTAQGAVCVLDSVNHLCQTAQLEAFFRRLRLFVEPGGLFIFDVNTPYKHRCVLGDNAFVFDLPELTCVWQNHLLSRGDVVDMRLDFFVEQPDGRYERYCDAVRERAYSDKTMQKLLRDCGWQVLAVYDDMSFDAPAAESERVVYVVRNTRTREEATGNG